MGFVVSDEIKVSLDGVMGDDSDIARIARVSTGSQAKGGKADLKLLTTLIRDDHGSPLEMGVLRFKIDVPLIVVAQLLRHRVASYAQVSGRYVELGMNFYKPIEWRKQGESNRQISGESLGGREVQEEASKIYLRVVEKAVAGYQELLAMGVAREQARIVLPQGLYATIFAQLNVRSLMNLLTLRMAADAQREFQSLAQQMYALTYKHFPMSMALMLGRNEFQKQVRPEYVAFMKEWVERTAKVLEIEDNT